MYDFAWHLNHGSKTTRSAEIILEIVDAFVDLRQVLDLGCGDGRWLSVCWRKGASQILGVDGAWTNRAQLLVAPESVVIQDLSSSFDLGRRFDLAISLEVAEHVTRASSGLFVDNLVRHSDVVLFGAAIPHQGGFRHINEQWQSYWSALFDDRGYCVFDPIRGQIWDDPNIHFWYKQNALVYVRRSNKAAVDRVANYIKKQSINQLPLNIVHPEKFAAVASYKQIAFRPLIRELPVQAVLKVAKVVRGET